MAGATSEVVCCWVGSVGHTWQRPDGLVYACIFCNAVPLLTPPPANGLVFLKGQGSMSAGKAEQPGGGSASVGTPTVVLAVVAIEAAIEA